MLSYIIVLSAYNMISAKITLLDDILSDNIVLSAENMLSVHIMLSADNILADSFFVALKTSCTRGSYSMYTVLCTVGQFLDSFLHTGYYKILHLNSL
jgi:hypothetical protein